MEFAIEEERINREKHTSQLPLLSIKSVLLKLIPKNEITHIALNTKPKSNFLKKFNFLIKNFNFKNNLTNRFKDKSNLKNFKKKLKFK